MPVANSITVTQNSAIVTGYLTAFVAAEGDLLVVEGAAIPILRANSTSQITLKWAWPGATGGDKTKWEISKTGDYWNDTVGALTKVNEVLEKIRLGLPLAPDYAGPFSDRSKFDLVIPPFLFLAATPSPPRLYVKNGPTATDWSTGIAISSDATQAAVDAAGVAQGYATNASNSASAAAQSSTAAATSASNAAASAGAAEAADRVYVDTAAGLAAVADGAYFYVPSPAPNDTFLTLYRRSGSSAVAINQVPSVSALDAVLEPLPQAAPGGYAFSVIDADDRAAWGVKDDGTANFAAIEANAFTASVVVGQEVGTPGASIVEIGLDIFALAFMDGSENISGGIRADGSLRVSDAEFDTGLIRALQTDAINSVPIADILAGGAGAGPPAMPVFQADVIGHYAFGQSLTEGTHATPAISTTAKFNNVRFNTGVAWRGSTPTSFVPLTEQTFNSGANGETPVTGACECAIQLVQTENFLAPSDYQPFLFGATTGISATTIAQLSKGGSGGFDICVSATNYALSIANGLNKTYKVGSISWTQGTSDYLNGTSQSAYFNSLAQLVVDLNTDLRAITGQPEDIYVICGQSPDHVFGGSSGPTIAMAQLALSKIEPRFVIACAMYLFEPTDYPHLTAKSSKWLGYYYGLVHKRLTMDQVTWAPLDCTDAFKQGKVINMTFHVPVGKLVFDTTQIAIRSNYGFTLADSSGADLTISSVAITGPSTVRIVAAATIPSGAKIRYGWPIYGGSQSGGNLRDQQGDDIALDVTPGDTVRLDNWCVIFERTL